MHHSTTNSFNFYGFDEKFLYLNFDDPTFFGYHAIIPAFFTEHVLRDPAGTVHGHDPADPQLPEFRYGHVNHFGRIILQMQTADDKPHLFINMLPCVADYPDYAGMGASGYYHKAF